MRMALFDQIDDLFKYSESGVTRVGTGIEPIDRRIRGVAPGEVCMILGRSYAGKSLMAQNIIANNRTLPSIFFSMEMPYVQALSRLHSIDTGDNASDVMDSIEAGTPPAGMWELTHRYPMHGLVDDTNLSFSDMSRYVDHFTSGFNIRPQFVVVDYLELVAGAKRSGEGLLAIDKVTTQLKDWSKDEAVGVFVLHQCNRNEPKWLPPTDASPRYGGYTESDFVIGMWKPAFNPAWSYYEKLEMRDDVWFNILKNRPFGQDAEEIRAKVDSSLKVIAQ